MAEKRRTRGIREKIELDESVAKFLLTGEAESNTRGNDLRLSRFFDDGERIRLAWEQHRPALMSEWIQQHPGTRPWAWWKFDDDIPDPRQRIGGKGQTMPEKYPAYAPSYDKGIPSSWAEIDPGDPPLYESESAFLLRHGLLSTAEKRHIEKHPELLEPEKVE